MVVVLLLLLLLLRCVAVLWSCREVCQCERGVRLGWRRWEGVVVVDVVGECSRGRCVSEVEYGAEVQRCEEGEVDVGRLAAAVQSVADHAEVGGWDEQRHGGHCVDGTGTTETVRVSQLLGVQAGAHRLV